MQKSVLITGASSGIGRATAELMIGRGWRVAATTRNPDLLAEWSNNANVAVLRLDVTDDDAGREAVRETVDRFGTIDVLVNNAGYGVFGPLEGATASDIDQQFRTNVLGPINLMRHAMDAMRRQGGGTIVNVSSMGGRIATPFACLYHSTKFAIEGLSESVRYEAALHNIRIKLVEPAHFRTGFITRSLRKTSHPAYDAQFDNFMKWVLREDATAPTPEPVAEAILRAATDSSQKLRYPVKGALILALTRLLPDSMWRSLMAGGMTRVPKE